MPKKREGIINLIQEAALRVRKKRKKRARAKEQIAAGGEIIITCGEITIYIDRPKKKWGGGQPK